MSSVANPPKDRLLCYLQLVSQIKKVSNGEARKAVNQQPDSARAAQTADLNALNGKDLSNAEELFKLRGMTLDEPLLRLILKCFQTKSNSLL